MEIKRLIFPAPACKWQWDDFQGEVFWIPVPKNSMAQLLGIFSGLNELQNNPNFLSQKNSQNGSDFQNPNRSR